MRKDQIIPTHREMDAIPQEPRWPGVTVDSSEFVELPVHEQLRQLAIGYVSSAKSLCAELGENPALRSWPRALVVCFCFRHAVELFLKCCIYYRTQKIKGDHDITSLKKEYHRLYPGTDFFFQLPLFWSQKMGGSHVEDFEKKLDQVYRYFVGMEGQPPKRLYNFPPGTWLTIIEKFEEDIDRIWANIHKSEDGT